MRTALYVHRIRTCAREGVVVTTPRRKPLSGFAAAGSERERELESRWSCQDCGPRPCNDAYKFRIKVYYNASTYRSQTVACMSTQTFQCRIHKRLYEYKSGGDEVWLPRHPCYTLLHRNYRRGWNVECDATLCWS